MQPVQKMMRKTPEKILQKKKNGQKITMLTAYDYPMAKLVDRAGIDMILVGDSVANVVLGLESTTEVGMIEMLHHAKAVNRAVESALVIGDMPFGSYSFEKDAIENAQRFMEVGCQAVKLEWIENGYYIAKALVKAGIPVMGHVGLTPQTAQKMTVQGKDEESAKKILENAKLLDEAGCFTLVIECVPRALAKDITDSVSMATIGIGAGSDCDGQVLVTHDLLGFDDRQPRFAKKYIDLNQQISVSIHQFLEEVDNGQYPSESHSF